MACRRSVAGFIRSAKIGDAEDIIADGSGSDLGLDSGLGDTISTGLVISPTTGSTGAGLTDSGTAAGSGITTGRCV